MAVRSYNINSSPYWSATTAADNAKSILEPDRVNQWKYTWDGLGGTDTLYFDRLRQSDFKIYKGSDGLVHVDSVVGASHMIYVTLTNVEKLAFSYGTQIVDLSPYLGGLTVNTPPTGGITINGTPTQGNVLTAASTLADVDGLGPLNWQWKAAGVAIAGATSSTFTPTQAQVGKAITVTASYTDQRGTSESVSSAATTAVGNVNDTPVGLPSITGIAGKGQVLHAEATFSDPDGLPTAPAGALSWQWLSNGSAIAGATTDALVLSAADVGKSIGVRVSYTDLGGTTETLVSTSTSPVLGVSLAGAVSYWSGSAPMPAVEIDVAKRSSTGSSDPVTSSLSSSTGAWSLDDLDFDRLVVSVHATRELASAHNAISSLDVLVALEMAAGRQPLGSNEAAGSSTHLWRSIACDIDRDGSVTDHDAMAILLQAVAGPLDQTPQFVFLPADAAVAGIAVDPQTFTVGREFAPAAQIESNWIGALLGDGDGSWRPVVS